MVVALVIFTELIMRIGGMIAFKLPFFKQDQIILNYYPELHPFFDGSIPMVCNDSIRLVIFGGSAVTNTLCDLPELIQNLNIPKPNSKPLAIYSLARYAQNSMDSRIKYQLLNQFHFDYVFVYDGINDTRVNNCPDEFFNDDYSHIGFYDEVNTYIRHPELKYFVSLYYAERIWKQWTVAMGLKKYIPKEFSVLHPGIFERDVLNEIMKKDTTTGIWHQMKTRPNTIVDMNLNPFDTSWLKEGAQIKSAGTFRKNLLGLIHLAKTKNEQLILSTYAIHSPPDYSISLFLKGKLDYAANKWPTELYGLPENVVKGVRKHNEIIHVLSNKYNLPLVDFEAKVPHNKDYFLDICHLNTKGCDLLAKLIHEKISNN